MPTLTVDGIGAFRVPAGKRLVNALEDECGLDQLHACGGHAKCTTCRVIFLAGEPATMRPAEREALAASGIATQSGVRLSCQITCDADMTVRVFNRLAGSGRSDCGARPADVIEPADAREPVRDIETFRIVKWLTSPSDHGRAPGGAVEVEEPFFRPILRPAVPVLTVLDDGSMDVGEEIRIRKPTFLIGRSAGDLTLPNDATISGRHAEIRMVLNRGIVQWTLHNLESINGTFVRVNHASFFLDTIVIIGSRRYRLDTPVQQVAAADARTGEGTVLVDRESPDTPWPVLVDSAGRPESVRYPIRKPAVTIGGASGGCDIELDDPLVAKRHATLQRDPNGIWQIYAAKTRNGIWANIHSVALTSFCYFQCGEQRFRFTIP